jgi:hypothetical protein
MNETLMHVLAIVAPIAEAFYLVHQIHKRDLRGWQHYACLTSLVFLVSVLFLIGGGRIKSFGLAGNTVEVVDQKLEEIKALAEKVQKVASVNAELSAKLAVSQIYPLGKYHTIEHWQPIREKVFFLLKESGAPSNHIAEELKVLDVYIAELKQQQPTKP